MKALNFVIVIAAIVIAAPANAQQARQQGASRQPVQSTPTPVQPLENKALVRMKCHFGTASPKVCAKIGFVDQPVNSRI